jgi:MYXO-CTERM domain-containing protein
MKTFARRALGMGLISLAAACASGGGGCGGCSPIPGGFPRESVVTNAATLRITRPGFDFIGANAPTVVSSFMKLPGGVFKINIPKVSKSFGPFTAALCPDGAKPNNNPPDCVAEVSVANTKLRVDAVAPGNLVIRGTLPVRLRYAPGDVSVIGGIAVGLGNGACDGGTPKFDYKDFGITVTVRVIEETRPPRNGFTRLEVDVNPAITRDDVSVCKSCGIITGGCNAALDFVKDQIFDSIFNGVKEQVHGAVAGLLCMKPNAAANPQCPTGTKVKDGQCVYANDETSCVPLALGSEGRLDLSGAFASISPGTSGGLDFALGGSGAGDSVPSLPANGNGETTNGLTLTMLGGALPFPQSSCVPKFDNPPPKSIPVPDELRKDTVTPWPAGTPAPHVGIALSGRFLNYAFGSAYNSGILCLGISTEQVQLVQSGLVSVLIPGVKKLTFEQKAAAVAITTRPQRPPKLRMGTGKDIATDPLIALELPEFAVDFYVWSLDRFVRAFTFTGDLTVPVNLQTGKSDKNPKGGLLPVVGSIKIEHAVVTNNDLLSDDPAAVAAALSSIVGGLSGQLTGAIGAIDVSSLLSGFGLGINVPDGAIRSLTKGGDQFLAIFGSLSKGTTAHLEADTEAHLVGKVVHPEAMGIATMSRAALPELNVAFSSPAVGPVEYSWALDHGTRSAWSSDANVTIKDDYLVFQGKHELKVWARLKGEMETEDTTPAVVPYTIDTLPPGIEVKKTDGGDLAVRAWDYVSPNSELMARYQLVEADGSEAPFTEWAPLGERETIAAGDATSVKVQVRDPEGNVGEENALIRGKPDGSLQAAGGCDCSAAPRSGGPSGLWAFGAVAGLFFAARRRRRSRTAAAGLGTIAVLASFNQGCGCGSDDNAEDLQKKFGCGADCKEACKPALPPGEVGSYTSVAKAKSGALWIAGYNDGVFSEETENAYGDLVVGQYDAVKGKVQWTSVDGVPKRTDNSCPPSERTGWRNGEVEPGDNVGLWTSLQIDASDRPMVSYYDATNHALKFAIFDSQRWVSYTVMAPADGKGDVGRYGKLAVVEGKPVIVFSANLPGVEGFVRSKIVLAKSRSPSPMSDGEWSFEDVMVEEQAPCRFYACAAGEACVRSTGKCTATQAGCTPADCGNGKACVPIDGKASCQEVLNDAFIEAYPSSIGDYISVAIGPEGLGVVAYDRIHGNLVGMKRQGPDWAVTILDGETGARPKATDTGDMGIGASLFITANGDWHTTYVDGISEALVYMRAPGGKPGARELVDDGFRLGKDAPVFADGRHIVGDDSFVRADDAGNVTIAYQDASKGELRFARGAPNGKGHTWTLTAVPQEGRFAGFFPNLVPAGEEVVNYWRQLDAPTRGLVGDVALVKP